MFICGWVGASPSGCKVVSAMASGHHTPTDQRCLNPKIGSTVGADLDRLVFFVRKQDPALDEPAALSKLALALACDVGRWRRHELRVLNRGHRLVTIERSRPALNARHHAAALEAGRWAGVPLPADIAGLSKHESDHAIRRWYRFVDRLGAVGVHVDRRAATQHLSRSEQLVRANRERALGAALHELKPGASREVRLAVVAAKLALHETDARPDRAALKRLADLLEGNAPTRVDDGPLETGTPRYPEIAVAA